jgi:hypothetical protein
MTTTIDQVIANHTAQVNSKSSDFEKFVNALLDAATVLYESVVEDVIARHVSLDVVTQMLDSIAGDFPTVPAVTVPVFSVPNVPDVSFSIIERDLLVLETARGLALRDLEDGGHGIHANDELGLVERLTIRATADAQTAVDELQRVITTRRFEEPPGTLFGSLERARAGQREAVAGAARDVYITSVPSSTCRPASSRSRWHQCWNEPAQMSKKLDSVWRRHARAMHSNCFRPNWSTSRFSYPALSTRRRCRCGYSRAQGAVANAKAQIVAEKAKVFIGEYETNVRAFLGVMTVRLENAKNRLNAAASNAESRREAAKAGAQLFGGIIAHALGGLNTMVSQSKTEA